jgi:hypothetical protein
VTGSLLPISSSWCHAPSDSWAQIPPPQLNLCGNSLSATSSLTRWVCLLWICLAFRQVYISHI